MMKEPLKPRRGDARSGKYFHGLGWRQAPCTTAAVFESLNVALLPHWRQYGRIWSLSPSFLSYLNFSMCLTA